MLFKIVLKSDFFNLETGDRLELRHENILLRHAVDSDLDHLWQLIYSDLEWKNFDGPYYPFKTASLEEFRDGFFSRLKHGERARLIELDGQVIGLVSYYWEDENTRWLEAGIVIYDSQRWGKGIGRKALVPWIIHLFNTLEIERVGMTTWSGNPRMIACAKAVGFQVEGILRKVRYHKGEYFDSVKLGILRDEWFELHPILNTC